MRGLVSAQAPAHHSRCRFRTLGGTTLCFGPHRTWQKQPGVLAVGEGPALACPFLMLDLTASRPNRKGVNDSRRGGKRGDTFMDSP